MSPASFFSTRNRLGRQGEGDRWGARRIRSPGAPLTHMGGISSGFAVIEGRVTKRATHVRLRFRDGQPPIDLVVIRAGDRALGHRSRGPRFVQHAGLDRERPTSEHRD